MSFEGWVNVISIVAGFWAAVYFAKFLIGAASRFFGWAFGPAERRLLQWLQDRAAARALGIDIEILRARRKIDGYG